MDYDNSNSGALFKNNRKEKSNQPDYRGEATTKCSCGKSTTFWLSAWIKTSRAGAKYMSMAYTEKDIQPEAPVATGLADDDDIPF
jgi:uncharacterized protein (DUF736 family)